MPIEHREFIYRHMLKAEPDKFFVFGDNLERSGYGGQAKEMRGEPNAIGIPTKIAPYMHDDAFFTDKSLKDTCMKILPDYLFVEAVLQAGHTVVWPSHNIGTGLSAVADKAPVLWSLMEGQREKFIQEYGLIVTQ